MGLRDFGQNFLLPTLNSVISMEILLGEFQNGRLIR
jgi:hypothetical protein